MENKITFEFRIYVGVRKGQENERNMSKILMK